MFYYPKVKGSFVQYSFGYKMVFLSFQNNPINLDLSLKTDLDL